jgi:hypothetical protein
MKYRNGNSLVSISNDGTRVIQFDDVLELDYPLNIDIRVSTKCSFGRNPITGKSFCSFCHESARMDGIDCDFSALQEKLSGLPQGVELAVGSNELTDGLVSFLEWSKRQGYIVNLTTNQGHLKRDSDKLKYCVDNELVKGIGVSYRAEVKWNVPQWILDYPNTIFHVIAGIDSLADVCKLPERGVKKVLVLGEKDFGFNAGKVNLLNYEHRRWLWYISKMFSMFDVVSFDNLALEQLKIRRFFPDEQWDIFNQGEHSMYINAVEGYFAPSSRSPERTNWNTITLPDYFKSLEKYARQSN